MNTAALLARMDKGEAIIASDETMDALDDAGRNDIKSAYNRDRIGTKDVYVVWTVADVKTTPIAGTYKVSATAHQ
jgi:hypothetical protein